MKLNSGISCKEMLPVETIIDTKWDELSSMQAIANEKSLGIYILNHWEWAIKFWVQLLEESIKNFIKSHNKPLLGFPCLCASATHLYVTFTKSSCPLRDTVQFASPIGSLNYEKHQMQEFHLGKNYKSLEEELCQCKGY